MKKKRRGCTRCGLHRDRRQEVPSRGAEPADILFIGDAPGKSEDLRGRPFIGATGRILNAAVRDAADLAGLARPPAAHVATVVRCVPLDKTDSRGGTRPPTEQEAAACWPHLEEVYLRVRPRFVVYLGRETEKLCKNRIPGGKYVYHPAYILRCGGRRSSAYREMVREFVDLFKAAKEEECTWREKSQ